MMQDFAIGLLPVLLQILVAGLTTTVFEYFQKLLLVVERLPAIAKQASVAVIAYGLTYAGVQLGVTIAPDVSAVTADDFSALLSAGLAFLFHQGAKTKALSNRVGSVRLGLMLSLVFIGACATAAAAGGGKVQPPRDVSTATAIEADTASVRVRCTVPANTTCRWASSVGAAPDGIEAVFKFAAPAPGDSVQVVGTARAVRRGLVSATATPFAAWVKRGDVPPGAPDSVVVVEIVVPPVTN
jgi:hypothetical protein